MGERKTGTRSTAFQGKQGIGAKDVYLGSSFLLPSRLGEYQPLRQRNLDMA
ncbi:MAG: hypothetical protein AAGU25_05925 [bacterium]